MAINNSTTEKEEIKLYDDQVTVVFYPKSHRYKVNGEWVTSVSAATGIVDKSRVLIYWAINLAKNFLLSIVGGITEAHIEEACKQHTIKKEEAASIGKDVHDWAEEFAKGNRLPTPEREEAANGVLAFLKWTTDHNVEFEVTERMVYSKKHNYVGRFDCIIKVDGKRYLADYKTSNKFYAFENRMQTAGYVNAYYEETGDQLDGRMIIRFGKDNGEFEVHMLDEGDVVPMMQWIHVGDNQYSKDITAFLAAMTLKNRQKECDTYSNDY